MADAGARRRPRLVLTDAVRDGHLAIFVKREVQAGVLALQNGENPPALVAVAIATFLLVTSVAFFVFGVALMLTWVFVCGAFLAVTLGGAEGLRVFCLSMYMLAIFLWGNVKLFHAGVKAFCARLSHFLFHVGPAPRRPAAGTSDDPVMVFDDDEGKRVDHPIEVG